MGKTISGSYWKSMAVLLTTLFVNDFSPRLTVPAFSQSHGLVQGADAVVRKATSAGMVRVIARLSKPAAPEGQPLEREGLASARRNLEQAMESVGAVNSEPIEGLPYVVLEVDRRQLDSLLRSGMIEAIQEDRIDHTFLAQSVPLINVPNAWNVGARGAGQTVAILDTGVDSNHTFLAGRVVSEACFSSNSATQGASTVCPNGQTNQTGARAGAACVGIAGCDHGTHIAGIAAGRGNNFSGVAPDANIIAIQVFSRLVDTPGGAQNCRRMGRASPCVGSFISDQIRGLQEVLNLSNQFGIIAANMSIGGDRFESACDTDSRKAVIDRLRDHGIVTVISSGNDGFTNAVGAPGCISTAVTVGSTTKRDIVSDFSNSAPTVDLLAPGSSINSSVPGNNFAIFSGTSMAAPHVAGAFAVLASRAPGATIDQIQNALISTGVDVTDTRNNLSRPRINVGNALEALAPPSNWQVASSDGTKFTHAGEWIKGWATGEYWRPFVADVNGGGKADLVVWFPGR
ncbi:S8 family peptidase [Candidatus Nitrospira nitrificans]|uniref:Subtilisin-like serine protease n=1 Tax=Candidatus Nitrospira nitrificans TaxID=1742973 RepID=A0A0S4L640_9BACT